MPTFALAAAGAGVLSAVFHALLLTGSLGAFVFAYLAQLPLFAVGLWMGFGAAAFAGAVAVAALTAAGGFVFAIAYLVANAAPAVAVTWLAQLNRRRDDGGIDWYPAGLLVAWLVSFGAVAFLVVCVVLSGELGGAEALVRRFLEAGLRAFTTAGDDAAIARSAGALARVFPGMIGGSWIAMIIANAVLAQALLVRVRRNLRPSPRMTEIDLPEWMLPALAICVLGAFMPGTAGFIGGNLTLIFFVGYALVGLGVIHALLARLPNRSGLLSVTYLFMFLFGWPLIIAALLGVAEPWLKLRRRAAGGSKT